MCIFFALIVLAEWLIRKFFFLLIAQVFVWSLIIYFELNVPEMKHLGVRPHIRE